MLIFLAQLEIVYLKKDSAEIFIIFKQEKFRIISGNIHELYYIANYVVQAVNIQIDFQNSNQKDHFFDNFI